MALMGLLVACSEQPEHFTTDVLNGYTQVKDQGKASSSCWIYAMLAAIETEHIMQGDSISLSPAYVEYFLHRDPDAPSSGRGMAPTLLTLIDRYGVVPYQSMTDTTVSPPRWAFMLGAEYTPREFAHSVCAPNEYVALTTTSRRPYRTSFVMDAADNWTREAFLNVAADTLLAWTVQAVRQGHGACWEGDTGRMGFRWKQGTAKATLTDVSTPPSDDHCMAIIGLAHDDEGKPYFILKNSWGTDNVYGGLLYMSYEYFMSSTVAVVLPRVSVALD